MSDSVSVQMKNLLDEYDSQVKEAAKTAIRKVSDEAVQKLKATSPKRKGKYARSWKVTRKGMDAVIHNSEYRLTHLLENGHMIVNQYGTYGRKSATPHIKPVEQWANDELVREIEGKL